MMKSFGISHVNIGRVLGVSDDTIEIHYREELDTAITMANSAIANTMYQKALSGDNSCMMYWLSRRAGWKETLHHEHTGANGGPIESRQLPATDDWIEELLGNGAKTPPKILGKD